jgi:hypothetical protein
VVGAGAGGAGAAAVVVAAVDVDVDVDVDLDLDVDVDARDALAPDRGAGERLVAAAARVGVPATARCPTIATVASALAAAAAMRERQTG